MAKKKSASKRNAPKRKPKSPSLQVERVEAKSLILTDEKGRQRFVACYLPGVSKKDGVTLLQLLDHQGHVRLELQVEDRGSATIRLCTAEDHLAISLTATDQIGSGISINDEQRRPSVMLGVQHSANLNPPGPGPRFDILDWHQRRGWNHWDGGYELPPA